MSSEKDNTWKYIAIGVAVISGILITYFYMKNKNN